MVVLDGQRSDYAVVGVTQLSAQTYVLTLDRALGSLPGGGNNGDRVRFTVADAGPQGADYTLMLNPLQGDADRRLGIVTTADYAFVKARNFDSASDPAGTGAQYTAFADVNASGDISTADIVAVKARLNDDLPDPPAGAALFSSSRIADEVLA
jgi:hypothetical protein